MAPTVDHLEAPLIAQAVANLPERGGFAFHDPCVLGTQLNLVVDANSQAAAYEAACAARVEIDRLDRVFNWRAADSEISRLNRAGRHEASTDLFDVITAAERWRVLSAGAYSGRLGLLLDAWRQKKTPDCEAVALLAREIAEADVEMDPATRLITRPDKVQFDLDGIAKGYIIDRTLAAAMSVAGVTRALVDIGGDVRCSGGGPWRVALPQPLLPFDNAPSCGAFALEAGAVATSGCGPRDQRADGTISSATIDPRNGRPVAHRRSATTLAPTAMDADALATAMLVLAPDAARACMAQLKGMSARVTQPEGAVWVGEDGRPPLQWVDYTPEEPQGASNTMQGAPTLWRQGWYANITFSAPPKDMRREIAFRSPYVAIWVSDMDNKPVRTLFLVGRHKEWHEGNHVWWRLNRAQLDKFFARSLSTRGSGVYKVYWDGIDDDDRPVAPGRYKIHVETSRERGGHSYRILEMDFSEPRKYERELAMQADNGGLVVGFDKF